MTVRKTLGIFLLFLLASSVSAQDILLIASSYNKGSGPYTSTIQTPLVSAGYTVTVWDQATMGWPTLDTLWYYDAMFFHGSERRKTGTIDSILTDFASQGGRLVAEGSNLASYGGAYPQFEKHVIRADWQREKQVSYNNQVVNASHPIAAGLPATFVASGYPGGAYPDKVLPANGGELVIQYQSAPGTAAVTASPRQAYYCGSLYRVTSSSNARNTLIVNLVNWVLQDPEDNGIVDMGYGLGTSVGQACPVWAKLRNYGSTDSGMVVLQASTDSVSWTSVDTTDFNIASYGTDSLLFSWTPQIESRYYLRATLYATGSEFVVENDEAGMRVITFDEAVHPKLFFTAADIPTLQAQAATTHSQMFSELTSSVNYDFAYSFPPVTDWPSANVSQIARIVSLAAFKAVVTPTSTYINNAKNKTMALCRYEHWETGNVDMDIYSARACFALAMSYDWMYPHFSKAQRDTVELKLREQLQRLAAAGPRWVWWTDAFVHNHNINSMSYLGSASYALYEEEPEAQIWEQLAINKLDYVMMLYGPVTDGSWYEAMNYWGFITWTMLPHLYLLREQQNIDYFDTPWIQSLAKYRIYSSRPTPTLVPMINEAQPDEWYGPDDQLALLAREYNDGEAQWMRQQIVDKIGYSLDGPLGFFFYDPTVTPKQPKDLSWVSTDQDTYFGRSAWADTNATYVTLKCGLPCGRNAYETYWGGGAVGGWEPSHFLPEQNSFTLSYGSDYFVQSAGLQSPVHRTRNSTTMLVNGQGQIGDSTKGLWPLPSNKFDMNPHLADTFMLKSVDYVIGDATTSYPSTLGLTRFQRHVLYVRPDFVLLLDDMRATSPSTYTLLLRNPSNLFLNETSRIRMFGSYGIADMYMLAPANRTYAQTFDYYYGTSWGGYSQRVSNAVPDTSTRFVNIFYPRNPAPSTATLLFDDENLTVARLSDGQGFEATCAIPHGYTGEIDVDSLWTDAELAVVVRDDQTGEIKMGAVRQATFVNWGNPARVLFESPSPVDVQWTISGDTLQVDGDFADWARIWAPEMTYVWVNDEAVSYFQNGFWVEIGQLENVPNGTVVDLTARYDEAVIKLDWTPKHFFINGDSVWADYYDIYGADSPDGTYSLLESVNGADYRYSFDPAFVPQKFFYVVARVDNTPSLMNIPRKTHLTKESKAIKPNGPERSE